MIIRRKFSSVYVNGGDLKVGTWVDQTIKVNSLSIGPTKKGRAIQWILANGMLIADRCILTGISWDELEANDLIFGNKKILLDDFAYQVRLLKVGRYEGEPNEWDDALGDVADESNAVWRWKYQGFWGQERDRLRTQRITRGYTSSRYYAICESRTKSPRIGWRPVLIPDVIQEIGSEEIGKNSSSGVKPERSFLDDWLISPNMIFSWRMLFGWLPVPQEYPAYQSGGATRKLRWRGPGFFWHRDIHLRIEKTSGTGSCRSRFYRSCIK